MYYLQIKFWTEIYYLQIKYTREIYYLRIEAGLILFLKDGRIEWQALKSMIKTGIYIQTDRRGPLWLEEYLCGC